MMTMFRAYGSKPAAASLGNSGNLRQWIASDWQPVKLPASDTLPAPDLTEREAERLGMFIRTLAVHD